MPVVSLNFSNVGPFDEIEFEFDRQVNVFTGPNNSGKSTVLWVLGDILVYSFTFPQKLLRREASEFGIHIYGVSTRYGGPFPILSDPYVQYQSESERWEAWYDYIGGMSTVGYTNFTPALRQSTDFRSPGPTAKQRKEEPQEGGQQRRRRSSMDAPDYDPADAEIHRRRGLFSANASLVSDETVIQKIIDLDYRSYRQQKPEVRKFIVQIGEIASEITEGFPIHFLGVSEDEQGLFPQFRTPDGDIPLNVLSQGTQSIIQWLAYQLIGYAEYYDFPDDLEDMPGILIVDEIDAHLHPSWQRRIIPTLTKHFPNLQIFCSTHSPLMLAGLKEGQVQLLQRDENGKVTVSRNEVDIAGWSADEILRNLLGVSDPTDSETVGHLERLKELRAKESLTADETKELEELRHTVSQDLRSGPKSAQVEQFAEELRQARTKSTPS